MSGNPQMHRESARRLIEAAVHHMNAAKHIEDGNDSAHQISGIMAQGCVNLAIEAQSDNKYNFLKLEFNKHK